MSFGVCKKVMKLIMRLIMVDLDETQMLEHFSATRMEDDSRRLILMAMDEDDVVFLHGISMRLLDLNEAVGSPPPIELAALEARLSEAVTQFYQED